MADPSYERFFRYEACICTGFQETLRLDLSIFFHRGDTWPRFGYDCPKKIYKKEKWKACYVNISEHLIFRWKREFGSQMGYTKY